MLWLLKAFCVYYTILCYIRLCFFLYHIRRYYNISIQAGHELRIRVLALLQGDYEQMVSCQKLPTRLSKSTWTAIQDR